MTYEVKVEARRLKSDTGPADVKARLKSTPTGAAYGLANEIMQRVFKRGRTVGKPPRYPSGDAPVFVGPRYPGAARGEKNAAGFYVFDNSASFHQAIGMKYGTYNASGGMASGLTVVAYGKRAKVMFRGRSVGQSVKWKQKKIGRKKKGQPDTRASVAVAKSLKISNTLKAWTIFKQHNINVLDLKPAEVEALAVAIENAVKNKVKSIGGVKIEWHHKGSKRVAKRIQAAIEGRHRIS